MYREAVVRAALEAVGEPSRDDFARETLVSAGFDVPDGDLRFGPHGLRSIGFPEPGERRSEHNVPRPGDVVWFDDAPAAIIVGIGESTLTLVGPSDGGIVAIDAPRADVGTIYSLRSLLEPRGTDEERHAHVVSRLKSGEAVEDLRADGVSVGEVERATAELAEQPTADDRLRAEAVQMVEQVKARLDAELTRIRRSKLRADLHTDMAREMHKQGLMTDEELWQLVPGDKPKGEDPGEVCSG